MALYQFQCEPFNVNHKTYQKPNLSQGPHHYLQDSTQKRFRSNKTYKYSRVPNKRGGVRIIGMVQHSNNRGFGTIRRGWKWFDMIKIRDLNNHGGGGWAN